MPSVETNSPVEVEINVTTETPVINVQVVGGGGGGSSGMTEAVKQALLDCFEHVAWIDDQGQTYYNALYDALYPLKTLVIITAVFEQGSTVVYDSASLDSLKSMLTVTARYDDNTTDILADSDYALSGVLEAGTSTVTATYNGKTDTFTVNVTAAPTLSSISAAYTQSGTVYDTDTLDSLKTNLVVTAHYSDSSTATVSDYTLSGTLAEGISTITVSYNGKTAAFAVEVTHKASVWFYPFNQSIKSEGTEDFGFTGVENYAAGVNSGEYAYYHEVGTEGTASTDPNGIKAINIAKVPDFSADFTISFWAKLKTPLAGSILYTNKAKSGSTSTANIVTPTLEDQTWSMQTSQPSINNYNYGFRFAFISSKLYLQFYNEDYSVVSSILTLPSSIVTTNWHHYAVTRKNGVMRFFFDGQIIWSVANSKTVVFNNQICIGNQFVPGNIDSSELERTKYSEYVQDLYITEMCKWDSAFDPSAIVY